MPGPTPQTVLGDTSVPRKVDVVVIGGGIVGTTTALELAERGFSVALCEKGIISGEQSSRNLGWLRMAGRDRLELDLAREALQLWSSAEQRTGRPVGFARSGIVWAARDDKELEKIEGWHRDLAAYDVGARLLTQREIQEMFPGSKFRALAAIFSPRDGRAEPQLASAAFAEAARERGAVILTQCAVRRYETKAGRIHAVETERGTIECGALVVAAGVWSSYFLETHAVDFPQLDVMATVMRTKPFEGGPSVSFGCPDFAFRRRLDGGYTMGTFDMRAEVVPKSFRHAWKFREALKSTRPSITFGSRFFRELRRSLSGRADRVVPYEKYRALDPSPWFSQQGVMEKVVEHFPGFSGVVMEQGWGGYLDVTPDAVPVIGPIEAVPGLYLASGFSGHGFTLGPAAGKMIAEMVTGQTLSVDARNFRLSRIVPGMPA